jgi:hypothetical protein
VDPVPDPLLFRKSGSARTSGSVNRNSATRPQRRSSWSWSLSWSSFTTDSQSASLSWCQAPIWDPQPIFLSPWNFLQTAAGLLFCPLWREDGSVIYCKLLLDLAGEVTLRSKSCRTHGHILLSHLRLPQPGGPGPRIYIPQDFLLHRIYKFSSYPTGNSIHLSSVTRNSATRPQRQSTFFYTAYINSYIFIKHPPAIATESFYWRILSTHNMFRPFRAILRRIIILYLVTHLQKTIATSTDPFL